MLNISPDLQLDDNAIVGQGIAIFGIPKSGKSNFVRVVVEETGDRLPMTIFDMHNEYYTLNERFQFIRVGVGEGLDFQVTSDQAAEIAEFSFTNNISVIIEMLFMDEDEQIEFAYKYLSRLWELEIRAKKPYGLIFEEAQNFVPQNGKHTPALKLIKKIALEGRKFGFTMVFSTQRFAEINKTVLGRCTAFFFHGAFLGSDIKVYQEYLPYKPAEAEEIIRGLEAGEMIYRTGRKTTRTKTRLSYTSHVGETPDLQPDSIVLRQPDKTMLETLQKSLAPAPQDEETADERQQLDIQREAALKVEATYRKQAADAEANHKKTLGAAMGTISVMSFVIQRLDKALAAAQKLLASTPPVPAHMAVAQMTVERVVTNGNHAKMPITGVLPPPVVAAPAKAKEWDGRSDRAITRAINQQQRLFNTLVGDIRKMPKLDRIFIVYLTQRETQCFEEKPLARYTGYAYSTVVKHRPADAERFGLIKRTLNAKRTEYVYQSSVRQHLAAKCPDLKIDPLVEMICKLEKL